VITIPGPQRQRTTPVTVRRLLPGLAIVIAVVLAGCGGGSTDTCGGIIEPIRIITPTPSSLTLDQGGSAQVTASLSGGCSSDDRSVTWSTSNAQVATVDSSGKVVAIGGGSATIAVSAFGGQARTTVPIIVRPRVVTTIDARPDVDTLSPLGTRNLTASVKDQNGVVLPSAPVVWRSLTPGTAFVSAGGVVTALAAGDASIEAATPRAGADSLRDTVRILIVTACSLVRPVQVPGSFTGSFDASTCQNFLGYRLANQYSITGAAQVYYAVRVTPTVTTALVPLTVAGSLYGLPTADTAVTALGVIRAGTFGLLVTAPAITPGTYTVTTELDPDPRLTCVTTDVTTGVNFRTAITPTCAARDIRILPALVAGQSVRITGTASGFAVTIELRNNATGAVIQRATATAAGGVATISLTNPTSRFGVLRVSGGTGANDLVTVTIAQ
jgi:hypothetical protein